MAIKALFPSKDDTEVEELVMEYETLTVGEMMLLERHSGKILDDFERDVNRGSRTDLCLLFFVFRKRDDEKLTLADVQKMPYHALVFVPHDDNPEGGDEGKAPSDEPATEAPPA